MKKFRCDNTHLVEEVEGITGIRFDGLTVREIKGALQIISMLNAGGDIDAAYGEHFVTEDDDTYTKSGPLPGDPFPERHAVDILNPNVDLTELDLTKPEEDVSPKADEGESSDEDGDES